MVCLLLGSSIFKIEAHVNSLQSLRLYGSFRPSPWVDAPGVMEHKLVHPWKGVVGAYPGLPQRDRVAGYLRGRADEPCWKRHLRRRIDCWHSGSDTCRQHRTVKYRIFVVEAGSKQHRPDSSIEAEETTIQADRGWHCAICEGWNQPYHWPDVRSFLRILSGRSLIGLIRGSGKTSVLMALLGEMHCVRRSVSASSSTSSWFNLPRNGGVAYAAQESWVQNETIKDNILFGSPYEEERYRKGAVPASSGLNIR